MADLGALAALAASRSSRPALTPPPGPQAGAGDMQAMLARLQQVRAQRPQVIAQAAQPRPKPKGKRRGILTQLGDTVKGLPSGIGHIATAFGKELAEDTPILRHHVHFKPDEFLTTQLAQSGVRTAGDIRHPERLAEAVRSGTIVDKALEDIGNLSIVGGAAGKALTAAGAAADSAALARAGAITTRAAALGGEVANAPISVPRAGLTVLTERGLPALGRLPLGALDETLGRRRTLGENFPTSFTAHGREAMKLTKQESRLSDRAEAAMVRTGFKESTAREKLGGNPTQAEEAAAYAVVTGQADIGRLAAEHGVAPDVAQRVLAPQNVPESHLSPEAAQIAQEYLANPDAHPRVKRLVEVYGSTQEKITRQALEGDGRRSTLEPEQVGSHDPLSRKVDEFHATWDKQIADAQRFDPRLAREMEGEKAHAWQEFLDNPDNYPARWRPRMVEAQTLAGHLREQIPDPSIAGTLGDLKVRKLERNADPWAGLEPGKARMFRGETPNIEAGYNSTPDQNGRWWTPDPAYARFYTTSAKDLLGEKGTIYFVDVPAETAAGWEVSPNSARLAELRGAESPMTNIAGWQEARPAMPEIGPTPTELAQVEMMAPTDRGPVPALSPFPTRPPQLAEAGVLPEYLPAGRSRLTRPKASQMEMVAGNEGAMGDIRLSSEKLRSAGGEYGLYSNRTLFDRWGEEARQARLNELYRTLTDTGEAGQGRFAATPAATLGQDVIEQIKQEAAAEARRRHPNGGPAVGEAEMLAGDAIRNAMREKGYEAWATEGSATAKIPASSITEDSPFLHAGMKKRLAKQWTTKELPLPLKAMEAINKKFKGAVLPWSIRWQMGDAISNYMLSAVAGEVDPITLTKRMRELRHLTPEQEALLDARVQDAGLTFPEQEWRHNLPSRENARFRDHPIKALQRPGYQLNSAINRIQRHGFYLEKLNRLLDEQGISLEEAGRQVEAGTETPKVTKAIDSAVQQANDVLGSFDELSPFERRYMRNIFPFYPWMRHITVLSARLAIDNPIRVAWVMRIGSEGADPNSQLPAYMRGNIHTPLGSFDSNFLNPFADATGQSPLTPEGAFRAMSPAIKVGAALATGADLNRGGLQLTRPFNTGRTDDFGRQSFNPLFLPNRWDELAYVLSQQTPQSRLAVNLAPKVRVGDVTLGPYSRYGQGSLVTRGKSEEPLGTDPRLAELARLVSIPVPIQDDRLRGIVRSIQKRKKSG